MDTSKLYIEMCDCEEIQSKEFDYRPNFHLAYNLDGEWQIEWDFLGGQDKPIWLPRQDQIQKMMYEILKVNVQEFSAFCFGSEPIQLRSYIKFQEYPSKFETMEQLWLAFYMKDNHIKTWNGEEWKKEKP